MKAWFRTEAADGFMLTFSLVPDGLDGFITQVLPELRRRGLFREEYEGCTLRENLGLPRPPSPYPSARWTCPSPRRLFTSPVLRGLGTRRADQGRRAERDG